MDHIEPLGVVGMVFEIEDAPCRLYLDGASGICSFGIREIDFLSGRQERLLTGGGRQIPCFVAAGRDKVSYLDLVEAPFVNRPIAVYVDKRVTGCRLDDFLVLRNLFALAIGGERKNRLVTDA